MLVFSGQFLIKSPVLNLVRIHLYKLDVSLVRSLSYKPHASFSQQFFLQSIVHFVVSNRLHMPYFSFNQGVSYAPHASFVR